MSYQPFQTRDTVPGLLVDLRVAKTMCRILNLLWSTLEIDTKLDCTKIPTVTNIHVSRVDSDGNDSGASDGNCSGSGTYSSGASGDTSATSATSSVASSGSSSGAGLSSSPSNLNDTYESPAPPRQNRVHAAQGSIPAPSEDQGSSTSSQEQASGSESAGASAGKCIPCDETSSNDDAFPIGPSVGGILDGDIHFGFGAVPDVAGAATDIPSSVPVAQTTTCVASTAEDVVELNHVDAKQSY